MPIYKHLTLINLIKANNKVKYSWLSCTWFTYKCYGFTLIHMKVKLMKNWSVYIIVSEHNIVKVKLTIHVVYDFFTFIMLYIFL